MGHGPFGMYGTMRVGWSRSCSRFRPSLSSQQEGNKILKLILLSHLVFIWGSAQPFHQIKMELRPWRMNSNISLEVGLDVMEGPDLDNGPCGKAPLNGYAKWCVSSVHLPPLLADSPRCLFEPSLSEVSVGHKISLSCLLCLTLIMCQP